MVLSDYSCVLRIGANRTRRLIGGEGHHEEMNDMITTDAALYGSGATTATVATEILVCGCGQEIGTSRRAHCPRCGCCLN